MAPPKIQLAVLLDTSGSMSGLIEQAKAQLWKIVNEFGLVRDGVVRFHYMFNPDGTRNLEEDPDRNLFK